MWRQHLFSKRSCNPQGHLDEFNVLTNELESDYQFTKRVINRDGRSQERRIAFIQDCGDRIYVGMDGKVPSVLGEAFPYSYEQVITRKGPEKGREITFVHGYFAPKGVSIPDLVELLQRQPEDLKEILERANSGESPVAIGNVSFTRPRKKNTDWDRIATAFERGKFPMQGMTFTVDGKEFRPLDPIKREVKSVAENPDPPLREYYEKKKTPAEEQILLMMKIALSVTLIGVVAYLIFFKR